MKTNKSKRERNRLISNLNNHIKQNKTVFAVYLFLRIIVIACLVWSAIRGDYESVFVCVLALVLFLIPAFLEENLGIHLPTALQIIALIFVFCAEILGEMSAYYQKVPFWDTMLHTVNGFIFAAFGFALVDIFNRNPRFKFQLSPAFLTMVAFCFSMTVGVLWEFFEFGWDMFMHTDMQKDYIINAIYSVDIGAPHQNEVGIIEGINSVVINGTELGLGGYLDIGLIDTMKDLLVNFIGALIFSVIGYFYIKSHGRSRFASQFIPTLKEESTDIASSNVKNE